MFRGKLVVRCMNMIAASSSSSTSDDHGSLSIDHDHEHEHKTQLASLDMGLSSAMLPCRGGLFRTGSRK